MKMAKKRFFSILFALALVIGFLTAGKVLADGATKKETTTQVEKEETKETTEGTTADRTSLSQEAQKAQTATNGTTMHFAVMFTGPNVINTKPAPPKTYYCRGAVYENIADANDKIDKGTFEFYPDIDTSNIQWGAPVELSANECLVYPGTLFVPYKEINGKTYKLIKADFFSGHDGNFSGDLTNLKKEDGLYQDKGLYFANTRMTNPKLLVHDAIALDNRDSIQQFYERYPTPKVIFRFIDGKTPVELKPVHYAVGWSFNGAPFIERKYTVDLSTLFDNSAGAWNNGVQASLGYWTSYDKFVHTAEGQAFFKAQKAKTGSINKNDYYNYAYDQDGKVAVDENGRVKQWHEPYKSLYKADYSYYHLPLGHIQYYFHADDIEGYTKTVKGDIGDERILVTYTKKTPTPKPDHKPTTPILRIVKIDGDGNRIPLPVTFKITDKMFPAINRVVTTDKSGEAKVAYLTTGDYSLEEIKTPEGYVPLDKPLSFSIKDGLIRYENDIVRTIYVKNDKKTEEPDVIKPIDDPTRQDIAATISKTYFGDAKKVILVQNMAYADSMSAMNVSQGNIPILYTQKDALFDVTKQEILRTGRDEIIVMGGTNTISEKVIAELKAITGAKITRVDGVDRFEVNKNSAAYLPESTNAVIASGMIYTDALSSVPYAHQWKAPILLVRQDRVPNFVADVLKARISNAVISGGKRTIGPETKQAIEAMIGKTVSRVDGADRYVVSAKMAKMVTNPTSAIITSGEKWSDALVAGPVAQKLNAPVLLTSQANLPMPIDAYLNTHTDLKQILLIGGPASIGESVRNTLKAIFTVK